MPFITPAPAETRGIRWLLNGIVVSRGELIVDARFLATQIDSVKASAGNHAIVFAQPILSDSSVLSLSLSLPIIFSRRSAIALFSQVRFLTCGYRPEMRCIAEKLRLPVSIVHDRFGKMEYSRVDLFVMLALEKFVRWAA
jgi:hypothetical protein